MVLALSEMQTASSGVWTRVTMSISYKDNHYTSTSYKTYVVEKFLWILTFNINTYKLG